MVRKLLVQLKVPIHTPKITDFLVIAYAKQRLQSFYNQLPPDATVAYSIIEESL